MHALIYAIIFDVLFFLNFLFTYLFLVFIKILLLCFGSSNTLAWLCGKTAVRKERCGSKRDGEQLPLAVLVPGGWRDGTIRKLMTNTLISVITFRSLYLNQDVIWCIFLQSSLSLWFLYICFVNLISPLRLFKNN